VSNCWMMSPVKFVLPGFTSDFTAAVPPTITCLSCVLDQQQPSRHRCKVFAVFRGQLSEVPKGPDGEPSRGPVRLLPARNHGVGPLRQVEAGSEPWVCGAGCRRRRARLPAALR
jgi:hypothetical protein